MKERWKQIPDENGYYVSNYGNVKRRVNGGGFIAVKQYHQIRKNGLVVLKIAINNGRYIQSYYVHRLVAKSFCKGSGRYVKHKDGNTLNNIYTNLEFVDNIKRFCRYHTSSVAQYSLAGVFMREYESVTAASRATGAPGGGISFCCEGKISTSGGYKWKYVHKRVRNEKKNVNGKV